MVIGFILTKTPAEEGYNTFIRFLDLFIESDNIIIYLLGNGVYNFRKMHLPSEELMKRLNGSKRESKIFACLDDMKARGINEEMLLGDVVTFESYNELILNLMEKMDQVFTF